MSTATEPRTDLPTTTDAGSAFLRQAYRVLAYGGLFSISGSQLYGFDRPLGGLRDFTQVDPINFLWNALLYTLFAVPHLVMTRAWYKRMVAGNGAGSPAERRVYILVSVATWFAVLILQWPLPVDEPAWGAVGGVIRFVGILAFLWSVILFFQGVSFAMIDGLLGVPGATAQFSHGGETPLMTDGPYAEVRHPMYRAATLVGLSSLLIHPNFAQLFWVVLISGTFISFIPVEEAQMIAARGDDYRQYQQRTPYRLFRGIW